MVTNNKAVLGLVFVTLSLGTISPAGAANITGTGGTIVSVVSFGAASSFNDLIEIHGVASQFPTCSVDSNGNVHARFTRNTNGSDPSSDRIFTLALTAYTLGKTVTIQVSDSNTLNGDCQVLYLQLT